MASTGWAFTFALSATAAMVLPHGRNSSGYLMNRNKQRMLSPHAHHTPMLRTHTHQLHDTIDRLIVVSDIHAHLQPIVAFDAMRQRMNGRHQIIFNGDLCYGGVHPAEVVQWVRTVAGPLATVGNHDEGMLAETEAVSQPPCISAPHTEAGAYQRLSAAERRYCRELPHRLVLEWQSQRIVLMHGHVTPQGQLASWQATPDEQATLFDDPAADLCLTGHTHYPYVLRRGSRQFANSGSMSAIILATDEGSGLRPQSGRPMLELDADPRPSYLVVSRGTNGLVVEIARFEYDRAALLREMEQADHPELERHRRWIWQGILAYPMPAGTL